MRVSTSADPISTGTLFYTKVLCDGPGREIVETWVHDDGTITLRLFGSDNNAHMGAKFEGSIDTLVDLLSKKG